MFTTNVCAFSFPIPFICCNLIRFSSSVSPDVNICGYVSSIGLIFRSPIPLPNVFAAANSLGRDTWFSCSWILAWIFSAILSWNPSTRIKSVTFIWRIFEIVLYPAFMSRFTFPVESPTTSIPVKNNVICFSNTI